MNYLNNMLPKETDKIFINPKLWKKWGEKVQKSFIEWANISLWKQKSHFTTNGNIRMFHGICLIVLKN